MSAMRREQGSDRPATTGSGVDVVDKIATIWTVETELAAQMADLEAQRPGVLATREQRAEYGAKAAALLSEYQLLAAITEQA